MSFSSILSIAIISFDFLARGIDDFLTGIIDHIISAGISLGTIQVPGDGQPIILVADRQTSGGYARIANVITADLTLFAQMRPGDLARFKESTLDIAQVHIKERYRLLMSLR